MCVFLQTEATYGGIVALSKIQTFEDMDGAKKLLPWKILISEIHRKKPIVQSKKYPKTL